MGEINLTKNKLLLKKPLEEKPKFKDLLRNKSFVFVFFGQLMSMIAGMLVSMTFSYLIFDVTQNAALMVIMGIVGALPTVLLILFAGVIIDRFDQRKIMLVTIILRFLVFLLFLLFFIFRFYFVQEYFISTLTSSGKTINYRVSDYTHFIWPLYLALFIGNICSSFYFVTMRTYSKFIIKKEEYLIANSFNSTVAQTASVVGPILAGAIITFSYAYSFLIGACIMSLAVIFFTLLFLKGKKTEDIKSEKILGFKKNMRKTFQDIRIGIGVIKSEPKILYITVVYVFFNFATTAKYSFYNVILQGEMDLSATWIGAITAVTGAIAVITSLIILKLGKINRKLILVNIVLAVETIGIFLFAFNRNPLIMIIVIVVPFGLVSGLANIPSQTLRQEKIPHEKLGRVLSSVLLFINIANLISMGIITVLTKYVEPMYIVLAGGIMCGLLFIVSFILFLSKENLRCSDYLELEDDKSEVLN